jgi:SAM-dependent methyltransferase
MSELQPIFEGVYQRHEWGDRSGPGSTPAAMEPYLKWLGALVEVLRPLHVLDIGCGFWNYGAFDWREAEYLGVDLVGDVIVHNVEHHASVSRKFTLADAIEVDFPMSDLVLVKDVVQHLSHEHSFRLLKRLAKHRHVVFCNTWNATALNGDIQSGGYRPIDMRIAPFNLRLWGEYSYHNPINIELDLKLVGVWTPVDGGWDRTDYPQ